MTDKTFYKIEAPLFIILIVLASILGIIVALKGEVLSPLLIIYILILINNSRNDHYKLINLLNNLNKGNCYER